MTILKYSTGLLFFLSTGLSSVVMATNSLSIYQTLLPPLDKAPKLVRQNIEQKYSAVTKDKQSAIAWGEYGKTLLANRLPEESRQALLNAHQLDPNNYEWPYFLAYISELEQPAESVQLAEKALKLNSSSADVYYLLASAYTALGKIEKSLLYIDQAYKLAPDNLAINFLHGQLLMNNKKYTESKPHILKAMKLAPTSSKVRATLLQLSKFISINDNLIPSSEEANIEENIVYSSTLMNDVLTQSLYPENLSLNAKRYMREQRWHAAERNFQLLEKYYDLTEAGQADYALVLTTVLKYGQAEDRYRKLINQSPGNLHYRLSMGNLLLMNRKPEATQHYQWLLDHSKNSEYKSKALQGLGRIAAGSGDLNKGLNLLTQAIKLNEKSADMHMDLVRVYADLKQFEKAFFHLNEAQKLGMDISSSFKSQLEIARKHAIDSPK